MYLDYICMAMTNPNWILENCYRWWCYMEAAVVPSSNREITPSVLASVSNEGTLSGLGCLQGDAGKTWPTT